MRKLTPVETDYLKAAYRMGRDAPVPPSHVARAFGISRVSALEVLRRLAAKGFGDYVAHEGLLLNGRGRARARDLLRKHRLIECLLHEKLGVPRRDVCEEASQMDYTVSDSLVTRMAKALGNPRRCPCGNPIPERGRRR